MILHHEFIRKAKDLAKKTAIIDCMQNTNLTYTRALMAAFLLRKKFSKIPEKYVGVMVPTSAGAILAVLAVIMAGKIPVMINYSTVAEKNCVQAKRKCGLETIVTSSALLEKIKCPLLPGMICLEDILKQTSVFTKIAAALKVRQSARALVASLPACEEDDVCVILFTSGSEKDPKAVQLTHKNLMTNVYDAVEAFKLSKDDRMLCILPLFHVFGFMTQFCLPIGIGMTCITYANPLEYRAVARVIREKKPTMSAGTPIFYAGYVRVSEPGDFASLKVVVPGADKVPEWLRLQYREKHGIELCEGYGTTETSPVVSSNTPDYNKPGSIGPLFRHVEVKIIKLETGEEAAPGEEGKILVKGPSVMKGYLDPVETAKVLKDGWYDTGDIGVLDTDGFLWHKGRLKRFTKIGGELVSLVNVEYELEKLLPEGIDCCAVAVPDRKKGAKIAAAVSAPVDESNLTSQLTARLPMLAIPYTYVVIDEFPRMGSGKADFRNITAMVLEILQIPASKD